MDQTLFSVDLHELGRGKPGRRPAIAIVSDVLLYRQGLAATLENDERVELAGSVSGADALAAVSRLQPDAVLLDGAMDDCLQLARQIRAFAPGVKIVGFAISGGTDRLVECAESGFAAFVDCKGNAEDLIRSIFGALSGELACSARLSALLCERLAKVSTGTRNSFALTAREYEVAGRVGQGLSNKEIARELNIGPSTVKNHVHNILEKLNVRRRSAIAQQLDEPSKSPEPRQSANAA